MEVRSCLSCVILSVAYVGLGLSQTGASLEMPQWVVTAGDHIQVKLTLEDPADCDTDAYVQFAKRGGDGQFGVGGRIRSGQTTATIEGAVPRDIPAGDYLSGRGYLDPCPDYVNITRFTVPSKILRVKAFPSPLPAPTTGDLELSLTQKQFLETKAVQLGNIDGELNARLEKSSADTPELRSFLMLTVIRADDALKATEDQYRQKFLKSGEAAPAFFEDFHAQYQDLLSTLKGPIIGAAGPELRVSASLVFVQLKERNREGAHSGALPTAAIAVLKVIKDNIAAYLYVEKSGRITFDAQLTSYPPGARISYRKAIDDENSYIDYSMPTNIEKATFDLATWVFKFHKDGCADDQIRRIDPYEDTEPNVSVEFNHCRGK